MNHRNPRGEEEEQNSVAAGSVDRYQSRDELEQEYARSHYGIELASATADQRQAILEARRLDAYYLAGRMAAIGFVGDTNHIVDATIEPSKCISARLRMERMYPLEKLANSANGPSEVVLHQGYKHLLWELAGLIARSLAQPPKGREAGISRRAIKEARQEEPHSSDEGSPLARVVSIAEILAAADPDNRSPKSIIDTMEGWTYYMLSTPQIWMTVETVANHLLVAGTLKDKTWMNAIAEPIWGMVFRHAEWAWFCDPARAEEEMEPATSGKGA